ncbi:hypothetical protein EVAR_23802_1 [Eumeta japonica]|uniref:Uncharacterized protein n=1 Tax=Eumeta variegata TaxID=151549 RepID=A0A4C1VLK4_EUMVA|nr:hypothetical protein EVAR_23802_1 [Eumeta japonica]
MGVQNGSRPRRGFRQSTRLVFKRSASCQPPIQRFISLRFGFAPSGADTAAAGRMINKFSSRGRTNIASKFSVTRPKLMRAPNPKARGREGRAARRRDANLRRAVATLI